MFKPEFQPNIVQFPDPVVYDLFYGARLAFHGHAQGLRIALTGIACHASKARTVVYNKIKGWDPRRKLGREFVTSKMVVRHLYELFLNEVICALVTFEVSSESVWNHCIHRIQNMTATRSLVAVSQRRKKYLGFFLRIAFRFACGRLVYIADWANGPMRERGRKERGEDILN